MQNKQDFFFNYFFLKGQIFGQIYIFVKVQLGKISFHLKSGSDLISPLPKPQIESNESVFNLHFSVIENVRSPSEEQ